LHARNVIDCRGLGGLPSRQTGAIADVIAAKHLIIPGVAVNKKPVRQAWANLDR
jgi:hypothetical protein